MSGIVYIGDEAYVALEDIAECYEMSVVWVREVYDFGLLGHGEVREQATLVRVVALDRVASILRLRTIHGFDLDVIAALLEK
jgi:hypothetical protein